tara:strand:- start:4091 stop:5080 length:990 start_codon:yes stop_codon:yes gene_type:complete
MKELIANFSNHLRESLEIIASTNLKSGDEPIENVIISGLGGSGIGGTIVAEILRPICKVPVFVNKDYSIPSFTNSKTLFIACSYSGNTEETLMATKSAQSKGAQIACISSGGELLKIAQDNDYNVLSMKGGFAPRSMFAYSFSFLCRYFEFYGLADLEVNKNLNQAITILDQSESETLVKAEKLAEALFSKTAILYAVSGHLGIASRWRQQLNENAKMLAWEAEIPEMNHNELVGWEGGNSDFVPVFLRNKNDFNRNQKRIEIIQNIISQKSPEIHEIWSLGESDIERSLYLIHFGDWTSYFLSELNKVDIMDIKSIDLLKSELAKLPL